MTKIRNLMIAQKSTSFFCDTVDVVFDLVHAKDCIKLIANELGKSIELGYDILKIRKDGIIELLGGMNNNTIGLQTEGDRDGFVAIRYEAGEPEK